MSWFWTIIFLFLAFCNSLDASHHHQNSSVVIVGNVYCDTCFQQRFHENNHFISGASVAVECTNTTSRLGFRQVMKTDSHGEFKVRLPFSISKDVKKIKGCSVRLVSSSKPYCAVAASATSSNMRLKSRKEGTHVFSAGFFTFRPLKQPEICDQKPRTKKEPTKTDEKLSPIPNSSDPAFLTPIQDPPSDPPLLGFLPPLPRLPPLPQLPRLPPLPGLPFLPPLPGNAAANSIPKLIDSAVNQRDNFPFPPNPFNPPAIFPPNPFQQPPSGIPSAFPLPPRRNFPPLFQTPTSPPFFPFPVSTLPSPPPPPPPSLSFAVPLPPFPFQPNPGSPGVPRAEVSSSSKARSP